MGKEYYTKLRDTILRSGGGAVHDPPLMQCCSASHTETRMAVSVRQVEVRSSPGVAICSWSSSLTSHLYTVNGSKCLRLVHV